MMSKRRQDLVCIGLLSVVVAAFFWPLIFTGAWIPRGGGDLVSFLWPTYRYAARSLRSGTIPLWNPHLYSGIPFAADNQSGVFYPVNLIVFALFGPPSYRVMEALVVFHVWLAAVGAFLMLRAWRLSPSASVLGGIAFALSDLFVTHIGNLNLNATAAWLPFVMLAADRAVVRKSIAWSTAAGALLAVAALAGHAQMLLYLALALALYGIYRMLRTVMTERRWQQAGSTMALLFLIVIIGLGSSALMLIPAWQMASHSGRAHLSFREATRYSLPPRALIGLIAPGFYGRGSADFWGPWERVEVGYAGVVTLVLAAIGVALSCSPLRASPRESGRVHPADHRPSRGFPVGFLCSLIPFGLILALGRNTPVYRLLYQFTPGFDQIRAPARLILLTDLGLAAMAGYGLDRLVKMEGRSRRFWAALGLAAMAAAAVLLVAGRSLVRSVVPSDRMAQASRSIIAAGLLLALSGAFVGLLGWRRWMRWALPLLLAADLVLLGSTVEIETNDPRSGFFHTEIIDFLKQEPGVFRIDSSVPGWQPNAALMHGLYDIGGLYNPLGLAPYQAYRGTLGERTSPRYALLGAEFVLLERGRLPDDENLLRVYAGEEIDVYGNQNALPRALFVTNATTVPDHEAAWQAIHAPSFDPLTTVVLERGGSAPNQESTDGTRSTEISFLRYGPNGVRLEVDAAEGGWLVLNDVYYPGWRAALDGVPVVLLRANYTFRAVAVPAGEHTVEMVFAPRTWYLGLGLSLVSGTLIALVSVGKAWSAMGTLPRER